MCFVKNCSARSFINTTGLHADNQFSFSEYNGYLRLVTTTRDYESWEQSCGLYIFDEELNMVGHIDELAKGESIKASDRRTGQG